MTSPTQPPTKRLATESFVLAQLTDVSEAARDAVGAALQGGTYIVVTPNDATNTIVVATTAAFQTAFDAKAARVPAKRTVTGAYTLVLADATDMVLHDTASAAHNITIPTNATVAIPIETAIPWRQYGTGQITFVGATGVTINSRGAIFKSAGQYAEGVITKVATDAWLLSGDIVA